MLIVVACGSLLASTWRLYLGTTASRLPALPRCVGIVIRAEDASRVAYLPGFVTDTELKPYVRDVEV